MTPEQYEEKAKWAEDMGVPNLAAALRNKDLQNTCKDISNYSGWIKDSTDTSEVGERVLVTDGEVIWIGNRCEHERGKEGWEVVYDGAPPFQDHQIIAWMYMPYVPSELKQ